MGARVSRAGWNGKGMWLTIVSSWMCGSTPDLGAFPTAPFIAMKTADGKIVPWLASQTDILAEDWDLVVQ